MLTLLLLSCMKTAPPPTAPVLHGGPGLSAELVSSGSIAERVSGPDDSDLVIHYTGEFKGDVAPCGCSDAPRGGLPRAAAYLESAGGGLRIVGASWLDDGTQLDGQPMADAAVKNAHMVSGLLAMSIDAVHVGLADAIALARLDAPPPVPMVSANITGPGIEPFLIVEQGDRRIAITGLAAPGHPAIATPGYDRTDPLDVLEVIQAAADASDVVVLLNDGATAATKRVLRAVNIGVVIETARVRGLEAPFRLSGAVWVRSHDQGQRLGELRLGLEGNRVHTARDRKIDLDASVPDHEGLGAIARDAAAQLKALDRALFAP